MEKEKKGINEDLGIEVKEKEMENLQVRDDLDIVLDSVGFISKKTNHGIFSKIKVRLKDGSETEIKCDNDFILLVNTLQKYEGISVVSKKLVEGIYTKDGRSFLSITVNIELVNGQTYSFFLPRSFQTVLNVYYRYLKNKK